LRPSHRDGKARTLRPSLKESDDRPAALLRSRALEAFGERPSRLRGRRSWAREAAQLVATGTPTLNPPPRRSAWTTWGSTSRRPPASWSQIRPTTTTPGAMIARCCPYRTV